MPGGSSASIPLLRQIMSRKRRTRADEPFLIVRSAAANRRAGEELPRHAHDWHQLIYASAGILTVWTERGSWIAPPHWGVWVPAGIEHGIRFAGESALRTLYLRPEWAGALPGDCTAVTVSPLLRELILAAVRAGMLDRREPVEAALATLIVEEFRRSGTPPFDLPQPRSGRLRAAAEAEARGTADLARRAGMARRTLERRFRAETGMSPAKWRRHAALLGALERLAAGEPVKAAAAAAGYASPSAFVAAFRRQFGVTPGRYFER
jgi:AraC-like DNA-binding protein